MDEIAYCNDLLVRFEEIFYHELSQINARCKVELIGSDFLVPMNIQGKTVDEVATNSMKEIKKAGLVKDMSFKVGGKGVLLKMEMKGCAHLPKEAKLKREGIDPYLCPISNMILGQIIDKLGYLTVYTAGLDVDNENGHCVIRAGIYEDISKIGVVSDWTKE